MDYEQLSVGDFVRIRLRDTTTSRRGRFSGILRMGTVTRIGIDILESELLIELDDGNPPIYASLIQSIIRDAPAPVRVR